MAKAARIVLGVALVDGDPSDGCRVALERARWLARAPGSRIDVVHSTRDDERWDPDGEAFVTVPSQDQTPASLEAMQEGLRSDGIESELVLAPDPAWILICRQVLRVEADYAVLAKRSQTRHDGRRLGSVSHNVLRTCPCPVWVVKPEAAPEPRVVIAAMDRSAVGRTVVDLATRVAADAGATLHIVHALQLPMAVQMKDGDAVEKFVREERADVERSVAAQIAASPLAGKAVVHVDLTSPSRAILQYAAALEADVVFLGTVARTGLPGLVVGNTAERLLGRLDCSIVAVKPKDFACPVVE